MGFCAIYVIPTQESFEAFTHINYLVSQPNIKYYSERVKIQDNNVTFQRRENRGEYKVSGDVSGNS